MFQRMKVNTPAILILGVAIGLSACATGGGDPVGSAVAASAPPPPQNSSISVLSAGNVGNGAAVDQTFDVSATFLTTRTNAAGGEDLIARSRTDFRNPGGTVSFDAATNLLTFDIEQGSIDINDTFGPILLADPEDFAGLENDNLSILISSAPEQYPDPVGFDLPSGTPTLEELRGDPAGVDSFIMAIGELIAGGETPETSLAEITAATDYLATIQGITDERLSRDFFRFEGFSGGVNTRYFPLKLTGTNSGTVTNYVTLGIWVTDPVGALPEDTTFGSSVFGLLTPANNVPNTGTATYNATIAGFVLQNASVDELRGGVTVTADFETRFVDFFVDADYIITGPGGETVFADLATLTGEGLLTGGNRFDGDLIGDVDISLRGEIGGAFFGPLAEEVGGSFTFGNGDIEAAGSFVGPKN